MNKIEYLKSLPYELKINELDGKIEVLMDGWISSKIFFEKDDVEKVKKRLQFMEYKYIKHFACYSSNYIEVFIHSPNIDDSALPYITLPKMTAYNDKTYYEISTISSFFDEYIMTYKSNEDFFSMHISTMLTLKIYNCDPKSVEDVINLAKIILFELSYKYDIVFNIDSLNDTYDENYDESVNPEDETLGLEKVDKNFFTRKYD